ncbi:MAG: peptidase E [SAR202 cluster bacterium]|nr:peptidase E [SAR202 cluster bacterium]
MAAIVGIGGGAMREGETLPIDRAALALTGKRAPRALFIPTASGDDRDYWARFRDIYGRRLGCETDALFLLGEPPSLAQREDAILGADLVYVGGGNTLKMMRRWRRLGVDALLREAHRRGTVLAGLSAGCICWFADGHSDSLSYYDPTDWDYIAVKGMVSFAAVGCPHYDGETLGIKREASFHAMMRRRGGIGIGIDNHAALAIVDGRYRVLAAREGAGVHRVSARAGKHAVDRHLGGATEGPTRQLLAR